MTVSNSLIRRALKSGNPVIETDRATFIWEGESAPHLTSDLNHWDENPRRFKRVSPQLIPDSAKSIWYCTLNIPARRLFRIRLPRPGHTNEFPRPFE
jgi:hypothetical protein